MDQIYELVANYGWYVFAGLVLTYAFLGSRFSGLVKAIYGLLALRNQSSLVGLSKEKLKESLLAHSRLLKDIATMTESKLDDDLVAGLESIATNDLALDLFHAAINRK